MAGCGYGTTAVAGCAYGTTAVGAGRPTKSTAVHNSTVGPTFSELHSKAVSKSEQYSAVKHRWRQSLFDERRGSDPTSAVSRAISTGLAWPQCHATLKGGGECGSLQSAAQLSAVRSQLSETTVASCIYVSRVFRRPMSYSDTL